MNIKYLILATTFIAFNAFASSNVPHVEGQESLKESAEMLILTEMLPRKPKTNTVPGDVWWRHENWLDLSSPVVPNAKAPMPILKDPIAVTFRDLYHGNSTLGIPAHKSIINAAASNGKLDLISFSIDVVSVRNKARYLTKLILTDLEGIGEVPGLKRLVGLSAPGHNLTTMPLISQDNSHTDVAPTIDSSSGSLATNISTAIVQLDEMQKNVKADICVSNDDVEASLELLAKLQRQLLTYQPPTGSQFRGLLRLSLNDNKICEFPESICQLLTLRELYLNNNGLRAVPPAIAVLKELETLDLSHNELESLPAESGELSRLRNLSLSYNKLALFPDFVVRLKRLNRLHLENNRIEKLPAIQTLFFLTSIGLTNNPVTAHFANDFDGLAELQHLILRRYSGYQVADGRIQELMRPRKKEENKEEKC